MAEPDRIPSVPEDRFQAIVESTPDFIGIATPDGKVLYMNDAFKRIIPEKYRNQADTPGIIPISAFHPPTAYTLITDIALPYALRHGVWQGESTLLDSLGRAFPVLQTVIAHTDVEGTLEYYSTIARDISEIKEREQMLRDAERVARLGTYVADTRTGTWTSSEILDEIFGIDKSYPRDVAGWQALIHPDEQQAMVDYYLNETIGKKQRFDRAYRIIRHNDGAVRWVQGLGDLVYDEAGNPIKMVGTIQDITEQKNIEQAELAQKEFAQALIDNSRDVITILDVAGTIMYESRAVTSVFGYTIGELVGQSVFSYIHPEDIAAAKDAFARSLQVKGPVDSLVIRFKHKDGSWVHVQVIGNNQLENPKVRGLLVNSRDVTSLLQIEAIKSHAAEVERLNKIMTGREVKIAELKQEIAELKKRLGEPA